MITFKRGEGNTETNTQHLFTNANEISAVHMENSTKDKLENRKI